MEQQPFGEDVMTIIMGIDPSDPGQHGRTSCPVPTEDAISLICNIKCMCEDFLVKCDKNDSESTDAEDTEDAESAEEMEEE